MNAVLPTDPFALLVAPDLVFERLQSASDRLERLSRRVCRPLDKPLIALRRAEDDELGPMATDFNMDDTAFGAADFIDTRD